MDYQLDDVTEEVPADAEYLFAVYQDWLRQNCPEINVPLQKISLDSSLPEWEEAYAACFESFPFEDVGMIFGVDQKIVQSEWNMPPEYYSTATVQDFFEQLARFITRIKIKPACVLGCPCEKAGAFLAVLKILESDGADVTGISPSTSLDDYTRQHHQLFLKQVSRLAPGRLPTAEIAWPIQVQLIPFTLLGGLITAAVGAGFSSLECILGGIKMLIASIQMGLRAKPTRVTFDGIWTFRDLAERLAAGTPAGELDPAAA